MLNPPLPTLREILDQMGEAGYYLAEIETSEGAAGNLLVCIRWLGEPQEIFPLVSEIELPMAVPELENAILLISSSGRRLREIKDDPLANLARVILELFLQKPSSTHDPKTTHMGSFVYS